MFSFRGNAKLETIDQDDQAIALYEIPSIEQLQVEPDPTQAYQLRYVCLAHNVVCMDAQSLISHIHSPKHQKVLINKGLKEDPYILATLKDYLEMERPHREARREVQASERKAFVDHMRLLKGLSREEREEFSSMDGVPPKKKRRTTPNPIPCRACGVEVIGETTEQQAEHFESEEHTWKVTNDFGPLSCWVCGIQPMALETYRTHYASAKHQRRVEHLKSIGVKIDLQTPETPETFQPMSARVPASASELSGYPGKGGWPLYKGGQKANKAQKAQVPGMAALPFANGSGSGKAGMTRVNGKGYEDTVQQQANVIRMMQNQLMMQQQVLKEQHHKLKLHKVPGVQDDFKKLNCNLLQFGSRPGSALARPTSGGLLPPSAITPASNKLADDGQTWCEVCQVACKGAGSLKQHVAGKKHLKAMTVAAGVEMFADRPSDFGDASARSTLAPEPVVPGKFYCEVCNMNCQDDLALQSHLAGKRHAKAAARAEPGETGHFVCESCNVTLGDSKSFEAHLAGKRHMMNTGGVQAFL